jgi:F0F1-type ATP synthase alpha subunit
VDVKKIVDAANHLKEFLNTRKSTLLDTLRQKAVVDDTLTAELKKALEEWKSTYAV